MLGPWPASSTAPATQVIPLQGLYLPPRLVPCFLPPNRAALVAEWCTESIGAVGTGPQDSVW